MVSRWFKYAIWEQLQTWFKAIAIGDITGINTPAVRDVKDDCQIEMADLDGDGTDELIVASGTVTVSGWGQDITLDKQGTISTTDIDGDGIEELLVKDMESIVNWVYRGLDGGLAPSFGLQMTDHVGTGILQDIDGDSILEVILRDEAGDSFTYHP